MGIRSQSLIWVSAQFLLIALIVLQAWPWTLRALPLAILSMGSLLALWVLLHNHPGNFNIRPEPKAGARLVTSGPYRHIRHPMYVALLMVMAGVALGAKRLDPAFLWLALLGVLNFKAALEERLLLQQWSGYGEYSRHTHRFIPWLW